MKKAIHVMVILSIGLLHSCSQQVANEAAGADASPIFHPVIDFLDRSDIEEDSLYGLYSYFLLSSRPNEEQEYRVKQIIMEFRRQVEIYDSTFTELDPALLNMIYIPVLSEYMSGGSNEEEFANEVLENYDYYRAKLLLKVIETRSQSFNNGIYFVTSRRPLHAVDKSRDRFIVQDLSFVNPRIAPLWVRRFLEISSDPGEWDRPSDDLILLIRDSMATLADSLEGVAEGLDFWTEKFKEWVKLV